jgi:hypothetical protein
MPWILIVLDLRYGFVKFSKKKKLIPGEGTALDIIPGNN